MRRHRTRAALAGALVLTAFVGASPALANSRAASVAGQAAPAQASQGANREYVVLAKEGASVSAVQAAVQRAGGRVTRVNSDVGLLTVESTNTAFASVLGADASVEGVARNRPIGEAPTGRVTPRWKDIETEHGAAAAAPAPEVAGAEPLADKQWDMAMIGATETGSYASNTGSHEVLVGIIDTGIDASNADIAPNFNFALSRNFAPDIPSVDGPCEVPSCLDPIGTDDGGHGTHVAGTVGAAINGLGVAGVAPGVSLVELKAGQDSGFFFLQPTIDAITYAGKNGIDVVNMSFFTDPWLYNCTNNPADSPAEQLEQQTIIKATQRAVNQARDRGVTLIAALGNEHTDLGNPTIDTISPDFPIGAAKTRTVDNTCLDVPTETRGVISISALGPSKTKADYSNYGTEQTDFSAPGGYFRDGFGTPTFRTNGNLILSSYPKKVLQEEGTVDADGNIVPGAEGLVFKDCTAAGQCSYLTYLQGTSMASPHAAGVAALIVSEHGKRDKANGGLTLAPDKVEQFLKRTSTKTACPSPPTVDYTPVGRPPEFNATCVGDINKNGFYGRGIVSAINAVS